MSKATPRPWRTQYVHFSKETWAALRDPKEMACVTARGNVVAVTWDTEDDDNPNQKDQFNAAHIVLCVNMHDELLEALKSALTVINDYLAYKHDGDPWKEDARAMGEMDINEYGRDGRLAKARAAIAKAEGRE